MITTINLKKLIPSVIIPVITGLIGSFFTKNSSEVYANLTRPSLSPPAIIFPFVWTVLYVLIGIALYFFEESNCQNKKRIRQYYFAGLALNLLWPILFFSFGWFAVALIDLIALLILSALIAYYFYSCNKYAGYLFIPYVLWLLFATYLNIGVVALN